MGLWDRQSTSANIDEAGIASSDLKRLAAHIAGGHLAFPVGLGREEGESLALLIRNRRREQLVGYLARQLAIYFSHGDALKKEGRNHVEVHLQSEESVPRGDLCSDVVAPTESALAGAADRNDQ